jgi:type IV pilus assembly protein PilV
MMSHTTHYPSNQSNRPRGFSLVEVLIAILVLSIGLLGLAGMQLQGAEGTNSAYFRSQATVIANELAERLHVNHLAVDNNDYEAINLVNLQACDGSTPPPTRCASDQSGLADSCDPTQIAAFDTYSAACDIGERLPAGSLAVSCVDVDGTDPDSCTDGSSHLITVSWDEVDDGLAVPSSVVIKVLP